MINSSISECDHKCETRNTEPKIGTDGSIQTQRNPRVDGYRSWFGPRRVSGSGFWTDLEPNRPVFAVQTRTAGGLPGPISNTNCQSAWQRTERWWVYGDTGMTEMDWPTGVTEMVGVTGSIYSGDHGVDRSHIILSYDESHTPSFPSFDPTPSFGDIVDPSNCVDPHGRVLSYLLTLFLLSSSQNHSVS